MTSARFIPRRLDKFLRDSTPLSVTTVRMALASARVTVGGAVCASPEHMVFEEDQVRLDDQPIVPRGQHEHLMLHKPLSVTSTTKDPLGKADLSRFMSAMPPGVFPIGRLDRNTTGLLLFTTDGDLANAVLHPDHHTQKSYWLWLDELLDPSDERLARLRQGVEVGGHQLSVEDVSIQHQTPDFTELAVTLREGKNRHIRRLCRALDFRLVALHRCAVGPLRLGSLSPGSFRHLDSNELDALWHATGGRERVAARKIAALVRFAARERGLGRPHLRLESWLSR